MTVTAVIAEVRALPQKGRADPQQAQPRREKVGQEKSTCQTQFPMMLHHLSLPIQCSKATGTGTSLWPRETGQRVPVLSQPLHQCCWWQFKSCRWHCQVMRFRAAQKLKSIKPNPSLLQVFYVWFPNTNYFPNSLSLLSFKKKTATYLKAVAWKVCCGES